VQTTLKMPIMMSIMISQSIRDKLIEWPRLHELRLYSRNLLSQQTSSSFSICRLQCCANKSFFKRLDKEEHPTNEDVTKCQQKLHTIRSVFIIDTDKRIRVILSYPMGTGRNIDEIIRVIDSLQTCDEHQIATPANWEPVSDSISLSED